MKHFDFAIAITLLYLLIILTACGSPASDQAQPCDGAHVGTWLHQPTSDTLVLNSSCHGTLSACSTVFTFTKADPVTHLSTVNVTASTVAAGCLSVGMHQCQVDLTPTATDIGINCTGSWKYYDRQ